MQKFTYIPFFLLIGFGSLYTAHLEFIQGQEEKEDAKDKKIKYLEIQLQMAERTFSTSLELLQAKDKELSILTEVSRKLKKENTKYAKKISKVAKALNQEEKDQGLDRVTLYKERLKIQQIIVGKQHADTANTYHNLGKVYGKKGQYDQAIEHLKEALNIQLAVLGKEHANTAINYHNLGVTYRNQGKYDEAIAHYKEALQININVLGKQHASTAQTYHNLGVVYNKQGKYDQAIEHYKEALAIRKEVLGEQHNDTMKSRDVLTALLNEQ